MKFASAALLAATSAAFSMSDIQCSISDYETYLPQFALAFQSDPTDTSTDCYGTTNAFVEQIGFTTSSVNNFSTSDWLGPVYEFQELLVQFTTVFSDC